MQRLTFALSSFKHAYAEYKSYRQNLYYKEGLKRKIATYEEKKINVGSGKDTYPGWVNTNMKLLDITSESDWDFLFEKDSLSNLLAEHVFEHLTLKQARTAFPLCYQYLKKGGLLRIAVPDGFFPDKEYIEKVKPGGKGMGADDHKILYDYQLLQEELKNVGFETQLLEYWDETGKFHFNEWNPELGGIIKRSKRFDDRNSGDDLKYTSLIIDAVKN